MIFIEGNVNEYKEIKIFPCLKDNIDFIKNVFLKDGTVRIREITSPISNIKCGIVYIDGMASGEIINNSVVKPIIETEEKFKSDNPSLFLEEKILYSSEVERVFDFSSVIRSVLYGDTVIFAEKSAIALAVNSKGWPKRSIGEPDNEKILEGPRECFIESALTNAALLRRKLLCPDFKAELLRVGKRTDTKIFLCYIERLTDMTAVENLKNKLEKINIDGILDSNYIYELISKNGYSLFKTAGNTERPDIAAARLLEGRIAVIVDGTPMVLTLPYLFSENFQSDEDYYTDWKIASVNRIIRYFCFIISVSVPALYISLTTFHESLLPTSFAISVAESRAGVPFSSIIECLLLILLFKILTEAGIRMPEGVGTALSIVGGIVVGQAAVDAKIVSAPMLIIVSLSGIAGLLLPRLSTPVFVLRLLFTVICYFYGIYGLFLCFSLLAVRILSITSLGVDYTVSLNEINKSTLKDGIVRLSWKSMIKRPIFNKDKIRMKNENN